MSENIIFCGGENDEWVTTKYIISFSKEKEILLHVLNSIAKQKYL